jgi:IclR family transcriptional regulator, KDG regulon repressor
MPETPPSQPVLVKSADRVLDIFELLAGEPNGLTISEISTSLGIARSSAHGLVRTLHSRGYLSHDESRRFSLGVRLIQLGLSVVDRLELRAAARVPMEKLVASTHDTALLVVPEAGELLYVDKVISDSRDVRTDPRMSMNRPLHCTSLGKALLAALADESVVDIFAGRSLAGVTDFSITAVDDLLADLALTRERSYSLDRQEAVVGVWCVGAPVRDHTGRLIAAISLSTIREFFDPVTSGPLVSAAAVEISHAMGWKGDVSTLYQPVPGAEALLVGEQTLAHVRS